jgi:hypothetical protein
MKLSARIARLERRFSTESKLNLKSLTCDELAVMLLDVSRNAAANESLSPDERKQAAEQVATLEDGVRWQAAMARLPAYAAALNQLRQQIPGFVPAIFGEPGSEDGWAEIQDLDKPRIMLRRTALRARADIADLIEAGVKEPAAVKLEGRFIAAAILRRCPVPNSHHSGLSAPLT